MPKVRNSTGSRSSRVYWRRRIVVLGGFVAVTVGVMFLIVQPRFGGPEGGPPSTANSTSETPTAPVPTDGTAVCEKENISVTAVTDALSYSAELNPQLSFSITNTGSYPCTINAGTAKQVYTILSGSEVYWRSTDCQSSPSDTLAMLEPGKPVFSAPFAWQRIRSSPETCTVESLPLVPAAGASYHLVVSVAGVESVESKQFILE